MQRLRPLVARVLERAATDAYLSGDRCLPALGEVTSQNFGFVNHLIWKPVFEDLTREFPDLTRAAGSKSLYSHPKLAKNPNEAAHSHSSPRRLQNEGRHAQKKAKNLSVPKRNKSERGTER